MHGDWKFGIMLDVKTFYSIPNWLDVEGRRLPVIVSGHKPTCWHCSEVGHLSAVCPGKKAPKKPNLNPDTLPPVIVNDKKEAHVVLPTVRATDPKSGGKKIPTSPLSSAAATEESKAEWLTVGKGGEKIQPAGTQSEALN